MKDSTVMIGHLVDFVKAANVLISKDKCTTIRHKFSSKSDFPDFDPDMFTYIVFYVTYAFKVSIEKDIS